MFSHSAFIIFLTFLLLCKKGFCPNLYPIFPPIRAQNTLKSAQNAPRFLSAMLINFGLHFDVILMTFGQSENQREYRCENQRENQCEYRFENRRENPYENRGDFFVNFV